MSWYPRTCNGCGTPVAARTDDPNVRVLCHACHPDDLPLDVSDHAGPTAEPEAT